jgi:hypothetical protein
MGLGVLDADALLARSPDAARSGRLVERQAPRGVVVPCYARRPAAALNRRETCCFGAIRVGNACD